MIQKYKTLAKRSYCAHIKMNFLIIVLLSSFIPFLYSPQKANAQSSPDPPDSKVNEACALYKDSTEGQKEYCPKVYSLGYKKGYRDSYNQAPFGPNSNITATSACQNMQLEGQLIPFGWQTICIQGYDDGFSVGRQKGDEDKQKGKHKPIEEDPGRVDRPNAEKQDPEDNADCSASMANPLAWIMCPVIEGVADTSDFIFEQLIEPMLDNTPVSTKPQDPGYKTWQGFRVIANIVLVGAMMLLVYGAARGGGS